MAEIVCPGGGGNKAQISPPQDVLNYDMELLADFECGASWTAVPLYLPPKAELSGWRLGVAQPGAA
jgi:hypothetical protein